MPSGPVPLPTRGGGWPTKRTPETSLSAGDATQSVVYGADTHFRELVGDKDPTQDWAKTPLPTAPVDVRNATRRVLPPPEAKTVPTPIIGVVDDKLDKRFALYDMSRDEVDTARGLLNGVNGPEPRRSMRMLPTHHINAMGELSGYRFSAAPNDSCSALPINRTMFHGTSAVQCVASSTHGRSGCSTNGEVTRLTADLDLCVRTMKELMCSISKDAKDAVISKNTACFDCSPCNTDAVMSHGSVHAKPSGIDSASRARDSRAWVCDEPTTIGIYHAFVRRFNHPREHRLFIVVTGGCKTACDQLMNINADLAIHTDTTAAEVCDSDEVWWLRKLCSRMRARLLHRIADAFGLNIPVMNDVHSFNPSQLMAVAHIETYTHDISSLRNGDIAVYNGCVDTTAPRH
ncbi:hypothetical protein T484DRAFT_1758503, partial [Baffinella frigidus]